MKKPQIVYIISGFIMLTGLLCVVSLVVSAAFFLIFIPTETISASPSAVQIRRLPPLEPVQDPASAPTPGLEEAPAPSQPNPGNAPTTEEGIVQPQPVGEQSSGSPETGPNPTEAGLAPPEEPVQTEPSPEDNSEAPPAAPVSAEARLVIANMDRTAEYVDLKNIGGAPQDISGWQLFSEAGGEECQLQGVIEAGQTLRVWSSTAELNNTNFSCNLPEGMWDDETEDAAILYNDVGDVIYQRR